MMEQSVSSRSPSGQWYPQQPQPSAFLGNGPQQQQHQQQQQWLHMTGMPPPTSMVNGGPMVPVQASPGFVSPGTSGMLSTSPPNFWGQQQQSFGMTPHQMMLMHNMYASQDACCGICCGPTQSLCCGPLESCCAPDQGSCCLRPGEPVDPFCCAPTQPGEGSGCCRGSGGCFDWTFFLSCVLCALSIAGFATVAVTYGRDDIFATFGVQTTRELDIAMGPYIIGYSAATTTQALAMSQTIGQSSLTSAVSRESTQPLPLHAAARASTDTPSKSSTALLITDVNPRALTTCTRRALFGSFGTLCMEGNLNANTFAVQLSSWTNGRNTLWLLAMVYTLLTVLYAWLIHLQRGSLSATMNDRSAISAVLPPIPPEHQEEFMKMTPQQQQAFIEEFQKQMASACQQNPNEVPQLFTPPSSGCCGCKKKIELYETPFYEFVRIAWLFSGITTFLWTCNLFLSFWLFSGFYAERTTGLLRAFWDGYTLKMNLSLILVTVFLAWPLFSFLLEVMMWVVFFIPWLIIRCTCKKGIGMYRPALPLSQLPAYIRADMFFMDLQDVRRLGFSRQAWMMLTGSDKAFFNCCEDPSVDKDPAMTQLMQQRMQWQQMMMMMMIPPWMQPQYGPMMGPGGAGMMMMPSQVGPSPSPQPLQPGAGSMIAQETTTHYPAEDGGSKSHRRRRHRSTHDRRHADPLGATPVEQTSGKHGAAGKEDSTRHRHRRRSRSQSRSRSRSRGAFDSGLSQQPGAEAAVSSSANLPADSAHRRRRHHSRSLSKEMASMQTSPKSAQIASAGKESVGEGHHRQRRKEEKAPAGAASTATADLDALMEL